MKLSSLPTGQARGARLGARGKLVLAAEGIMNNAHYVVVGGGVEPSEVWLWPSRVSSRTRSDSLRRSAAQLMVM